MAEYPTRRYRDRCIADAVRRDQLPVVHRGGARRVRTLRGSVLRTVFLGSGLLFLAMILRPQRSPQRWLPPTAALSAPARTSEVIVFGKMVFLAASQDLCHADGCGVHDLAGDDLAENRANAALVGGDQLSGRGGVADRQRPMHVGRSRVSRSGCWSSAVRFWRGQEESTSCGPETSEAHRRNQEQSACTPKPPLSSRLWCSATQWSPDWCVACTSRPP